MPQAKCYTRGVVADAISKVRTDLDSFLSAEAKIMENHGYLNADAGVRRNLGDLLQSCEEPPRAPWTEWLDEAKVRQALTALLTMGSSV